MSTWQTGASDFAVKRATRPASAGGFLGNRSFSASSAAASSTSSSSGSSSTPSSPGSSSGLARGSFTSKAKPLAKNILDLHATGAVVGYLNEQREVRKRAHANDDSPKRRDVTPLYRQSSSYLSHSGSSESLPSTPPPKEKEPHGKDKKDKKTLKDRLLSKAEKEDKLSKKRRASFRGLLKISKDSKEIRRTPEFFIEHLRGCNDPVVLASLCDHLKNEGEVWTTAFAQQGGVSQLFSILQPASACKEPDRAALMAESLRCIQTGIHSKPIAQQLLNTDNLIHVVLLLLTNNVMMIGISSWVVGEVVQHSEQGATAIFATLKAVSNATGGRSLYYPFVRALTIENADPSHKIEALQALNALLASLHDVQKRFELLVELFDIGFLPKLEALYCIDVTTLHESLEQFEHTLVDDQHAMSVQLGFPELSGKEKQTPKGQYISAELTSISSLPGPVAVQYTEQTVVSEAMDILAAKQKYLSTQFNQSLFGLRVLEANGLVVNEELWLAANRTFGSYGFSSGIISVLYKLRPWKLVFDVSPQPTIELTVDPDGLVDEVRRMLMERVEFDQREEYGILWVEEQKWLERSLRLANYSIYNEKQIATLRYRQMPMSVKIYYKGRMHEVEFDAETTFMQLVATFTKTFKVEHDPGTELALFEDIDFETDPEKGLLNDSDLVAILRKQQPDRTNFALQLRIKPQLARVYPPVPEGDPEPACVPMRLLWKQPLSDCHKLICERLGLEPSEYHLLWKTPDGEVKGLFRWGSLLDQAVPYNAELQLVQKSYSDIEDIVDANEDDNIWDEETTEETLKTAFEDGKKTVLCGSLNQLVKFLTNEENYDGNFTNTFLLTYRSFTTPEQLLKKLLERYDVSDEVSEKSKGIIQMRVCVVVKRWVELFNDERETQLIGQLSDFIDEQIDDGPTIIGSVRKALMKFKKGEKKYYFTTAPPPAKFQSALASGFTFLDLDALEVARQLTLKCFDIFQNVKPFEFFNQAWSRPKYQHMCPNVMAIINLFNDVSNWSGSAIASERYVKNRARVMEKFIIVAQHLRDLNNYHLVTAIVSGLNSSAILRLKWTKERLSKRAQTTLEELEVLTNMENSYKNYRQALLVTDPPCIPYFGVYLADLTFIEDGNPDMIDGLIHFSKRALVYKLLAQIQTFQVSGYNFQRVDAIQEFINHLPIIGEKDMYSKSLECEPRNAEVKDIE